MIFITQAIISRIILVFLLFFSLSIFQFNPRSYYIGDDIFTGKLCRGSSAYTYTRTSIDGTTEYIDAETPILIPPKEYGTVVDNSSFSNVGIKYINVPDILIYTPITCIDRY
jgi:hypothetical protein